MPTNMIDYLRIALYASLVVVLLVFFQAWDKDHPKVVTPVAESTAVNNYVPQITETNSTAAPASTVPILQKPVAPAPTVIPNMIHVTTNTMNVDINPVGGNIVQVFLPNYSEELHSNTPFVLLNNNPETRYNAQSGLLSPNGPDTPAGQATYTTEQANYTLANGQKELQVKLNWKSPEGVLFTKIFTFHPDQYEIGMTYQVVNQSTQTWNGNLYLQLMRRNTPPVVKQGLFSFATYFGAAYSSPDKPFEKLDFKKMLSTNLNQTITGGWAAMIQHYFVSAWIPDANTKSQYFSRVSSDGLFTIGMIGPNIEAKPGQQIATQAKFYAGPSIAEDLKAAAPGLQLTIDYGWLWMISDAIFWMMQKIYDVVGNWGWSIVIVTLMIKLMFYHLSAKSYRSMNGLKRLQPHMATLKEKHGDDKQKFTQAMLALYKKEKVSPLGGCLPILVQIPVFIALYWVLIESVQFRQAPFILWIHDLSVYDPYYILPVMMGLSMFLQQRLNPPPPDPVQAKLMMAMPLIFTFLFARFPAGLMLYWFVNNTLSFLQQWYIMRSMNAAAEKASKAK